MDIVDEIIRLSENVKHISRMKFALIKCYLDSDRRQMVREFGSFVDAKQFLKDSGKFAGRISDNIGNNIEKCSLTGKSHWDYYWTCIEPTKEQHEEIKRRLKEKLEGGWIMEKTMKQGIKEVNNSNITQELNYILYGPPGTGKTYNTINYAVAFIENKGLEEVQNEDYVGVRNRYNKYLDNGQVSFSTFHQSYGYEDFIEGIKPNLDNEGLNYKLEDGIFKLLCNSARNNKDNRYVMIIDEINRGNVSKVFGELITLIEKSKREGNVESICSKLPYSKEEFSVPNNILILGTMNTSDRSIALLDTALRRRFKFIEMLPDENVIRKLNNNVDLEIEDININKVFTYINKRIEILYDRDHTIGHSFFVNLIEDRSIQSLKEIFLGKIIPLLQEYFHDNYEKIRLVLADNQTKDTSKQFIKIIEVERNLFGNSYDLEDYLENQVYEINIEAFSNPEAYIKIYSWM